MNKKNRQHNIYQNFNQLREHNETIANIKRFFTISKRTYETCTGIYK